MTPDFDDGLAARVWPRLVGGGLLGLAYTTGRDDAGYFSSSATDMQTPAAAIIAETAHAEHRRCAGPALACRSPLRLRRWRLFAGGCRCRIHPAERCEACLVAQSVAVPAGR